MLDPDNVTLKSTAHSSSNRRATQFINGQAVLEKDITYVDGIACIDRARYTLGPPLDSLGEVFERMEAERRQRQRERKEASSRTLSRLMPGYESEEEEQEEDRLVEPNPNPNPGYESEEEEREEDRLVANTVSEVAKMMIEKLKKKTAEQIQQIVTKDLKSLAEEVKVITRTRHRTLPYPSHKKYDAAQHLRRNLAAVVKRLENIVLVHPTERFIFSGAFSSSTRTRSFASDEELGNRLRAFVKAQNDEGVQPNQTQNAPVIQLDYSERNDNPHINNPTFENADATFKMVAHKAQRLVYSRWKHILGNNLVYKNRTKANLNAYFSPIFVETSEVTAHQLWSCLSTFSVKLQDVSRKDVVFLMKSLDILAAARKENALPQTTFDGESLVPVVVDPNVPAHESSSSETLEPVEDIFVPNITSGVIRGQQFAEPENLIPIHDEQQVEFSDNDTVDEETNDDIMHIDLPLRRSRCINLNADGVVDPNVSFSDFDSNDGDETFQHREEEIEDEDEGKPSKFYYM